jgi:D-sedoheptulose 7-phosphate isomerase
VTATDTDYAAAYLAESATAMQAFADGAAYSDVLAAMAGTITASLREGGKLLIAGNGGSAGDAQHIAGEFVGRLMYDRAPLPAVALTTDASVMTAVGNDYGFDIVFERQVLALGRRGDVVLGISTSGNSPNVLRALQAARGSEMTTLGFAGASGGKMREYSDLLFAAPSSKTSVIQQLHITAAHIVCALVERAMFPR